MPRTSHGCCVGGVPQECPTYAAALVGVAVPVVMFGFVAVLMLLPLSVSRVLQARGRVSCTARLPPRATLTVVPPLSSTNRRTRPGPRMPPTRWLCCADTVA